MNDMKTTMAWVLAAVVAAQAAALTYPAQEVNFGFHNTVRNLNITGFAAGSPLNTWVPNGEENEDWRIDFVSKGVYEIVNARTGLLMAQRNDTAILAAKSGDASQRWSVVGIDRDFLGEFLYYRLVNTGTGKALSFSATGNSVTLAGISSATSQKWRIDADGLQGFAANSKVSEGEKAGTIGGLLGKTVYVASLAELSAALADPEPLTVVLTANLDCLNQGADFRIASDKTLIGSWAANKLIDVRLRTNDAAQVLQPSDNIIIKNMAFPVEKKEDWIVLQVYSSKNVWVDHCTFTSTLPKAVDEVGKFIWINTPYSGRDMARSPDFVTLSQNIFRNRYWCVAYGTQNGVTTEDRTTVMFNIWDSNVRRTPQIGNGTLHAYNNLHQRNSPSTDNAGYANLIVGDGATVVSERNRFEGFRLESSGYWDEEFVFGTTSNFLDNGSYTNRSQTGAASTNPFVWNTTKAYVKTSWKPSAHYGYAYANAYGTNGRDAKAFCQTYTGSQASATTFRYITDAEVSSHVAGVVKSPFLVDLAVTTPVAVHHSLESVIVQAFVVWRDVRGAIVGSGIQNVDAVAPIPHAPDGVEGLLQGAVRMPDGGVHNVRILAIPRR